MDSAIERGLAGDAALILVDVQEKLLPIMRDHDVLLRRLVLLARGARLLGIPILVTEQYPNGLGPCVRALLEAASGAPCIAKDAFSCFGEPAFERALRDLERARVIVAGIETHICVQQTVLDALGRGYETTVVADATSTRLAHTGAIGLNLMEKTGARLTSVESLLCEALVGRAAPEFKSVMALIREGC